MTSDRSVIFSIIKTDRHDITEILLKVTLNTINLNLNPNNTMKLCVAEINNIMF